MSCLKWRLELERSYQRFFIIEKRGKITHKDQKNNNSENNVVVFILVLNGKKKKHFESKTEIKLKNNTLTV